MSFFKKTGPKIINSFEEFKLKNSKLTKNECFYSRLHDWIDENICGSGVGGGGKSNILVLTSSDALILPSNKFTSPKNSKKYTEIIDLSTVQSVSLFQSKCSDKNLDFDILIDACFGDRSDTVAHVFKHINERISEKRNSKFENLSNPFNKNEKSSEFVEKSPTILALQCPTGVDFDTGFVTEWSLSPDYTLIYDNIGFGHISSNGSEHCGQLINLGDIECETKAKSNENATKTENEDEQSTVTPGSGICTASMIDVIQLREALPSRPKNGHKGTFGTALVIGGSLEYLGAPLLAAQGAVRGGAGIVALAVPHELRHIAATSLPEVTLPTVFDKTDRSLFDGLVALKLLEKAETIKAKSVLIGPGMGESQEFVDAWITNKNSSDYPLVIDADGLNSLAKIDNWHKENVVKSLVLTPHPGEMARLCDDHTVTKMSARERVALVKEMADEWNCVVLLKGAHTVIASPDDDNVHVVPFASSALSVGGSGDVLGGVICALMASGASPLHAAVGGCYLHGAAAVLLRGESDRAGGLLAREIADAIPKARTLLFK